MSKLIVTPGSGARSSIPLHARKGTPIRNWQDWDKISHLYICASEQERDKFLRRKGSHQFLRFRCGPSATYNCHGLTFASRRACVPEPQDVAMILKEDRYIDVSSENVIPGDIIIYYESGEIEHSGIVVWVGEYSPIILSKWGQLNEVLHSADLCPYSFSGARYFRMTDEQRTSRTAKVILS